MSASWKTREKAEANADKFRSGAEDMLRNRRFDITVARGRIKRSKARRVGPFIVGFGTGYPFRLVPEFATGGKLGVRWATGYVVASHRPRRSQ